MQEILVDESSGTKYKNQYSNVRLFSSKQFCSIANTQSTQGVIGVVTLPSDSYAPALPRLCGKKILILEDIQDPGNVGTLLRTAAAFDFHGAILTQQCADPFSAKAAQASAGALLSLWIRRTDRWYTLLLKLKEKGFSVTAADMDGKAEISVLKKEKIVLALGNEGSGLSEKIRNSADSLFRISINDQIVESLNVGSAGAICMYLVTMSQ